MKITYERVRPDDAVAFAAFVTDEDWPFHSGGPVDGSAALAWLIAYLFDLLPGINRIEGTTRVDNTAMRALFRANRFAKEAHYRHAWPGTDGVFHDAIGYAILRHDWLSGTVTPVDWDDEQRPPIRNRVRP